MILSILANSFTCQVDDCIVSSCFTTEEKLA